MYTLRTVHKDGYESNELMGDSYSVLRRTDNQERFKEEVMRELGPDGLIADDLRVIIWSEKLPVILLGGPLTAYIVSENGQTLARL